jgi:uncharacterized cupredoxin-like copper-binding protein
LQLNAEQELATRGLLDRATQQVGLLQARLRSEHLKTHLTQTALLAPEPLQLTATETRAMNLTRSTLPFVLAFAASVALAQADKNHGASAPGAGQHHSHADAIGVPGKAAKVNRTVNVDMTDAMRFSPASIAVKQGETVRFIIKNSGQLRHEFVLGTEKELKDHYELMKKFPEMEHSDPNQVTVAAGKTGEVIWQFTRPGKVDFACLQPGHYDAGMKGMVTVAAGKGAAAKADGHADHKH